MHVCMCVSVVCTLVFVILIEVFCLYINATCVHVHVYGNMWGVYVHMYTYIRRPRYTLMPSSIVSLLYFLRQSG